MILLYRSFSKLIKKSPKKLVYLVIMIMLIPLCYRYLSMDKIYLFQLGKNIEKKPLLLVNNIKFNLINIFKNLIFFLRY